MKATLEKLEKSRATLTVEVEAPRVAAALEQAFRRLAHKTNIPGFRKGKAPRALVERQVGREALWQDAVEHLVSEAYDEAVEEAGIEPVDRPHIDIEHLDEGQALTFKATVDIMPEVILGSLEEIQVERQVPPVTDAEVEKFLETMRERQASLVPVEGGAISAGAFVTLTYEGSIGGQPLASGNERMYQIGASELLPEVEEQLLGAPAGEEREVRLQFAADHGNPDLAGKEGVFLIRVNEVREKRLPSLDNDFAAQLGNFASLEELRADAENRLKEAAERHADEEQAARAADMLMERSQVELPESLVLRRMDAVAREWAGQLAQAGLSAEQYFERSGQSPEEFQQQVRQRSEAELKAELVLEAVAEKEGLEARPEEVKERMDKAGLPASAFEYVRQALAREKAVRFLGEMQRGIVNP